MAIYIVVSQADYDHSYSEHFIHCIADGLDEAANAFDNIDRTGKYTIAILECETVGWNVAKPFEPFGSANNTAPIRAIHEWRAD